jgi:metal-responsive CopG/Arc/MetJ family transcriptional regulator
MDSDLVSILDQYSHLNCSNRSRVIRELVIEFLKQEFPSILEGASEQKQKLNAMKDKLYSSFKKN